MVRVNRGATLLTVIVVGLLFAFMSAACSGSEAPTPVPPTPTPTVRPAATSQPSPAPAPVYPLTITDPSGRSVTIRKAPTRIVSLSPGATEVIFALGAGGLVIARDQFSDYPPEAKQKAELSYSNPNMEQLLGLSPDLVIIAGRQRPFLQQMEQRGLNVLFMVEPQTLDGVLEHILLLGKALDHNEQAKRLADDMRRRIDAVKARVADVTTGPRVFYELTADLYTVAPQSFVGGMFGLLKARNVAEGASTPFPQLSQEVVLQRDPEVVILADAAQYGLGNESAETVRVRPGWQGMAAVRNNRVYAIDSNLLNRPGPRIVEGLEMLAKLLYPAMPAASESTPIADDCS
ncbi:MAG: ABC transporter substrate-binding protein [Chloroflexi bacterium]|nr:ABC transporter substrate-binding protein [Chloroflexota bacterium]